MNPDLLQFENDNTGRKIIHPSALRFTLKIMEHEVHRIIESVVRKLTENNQLVSISR